MKGMAYTPFAVFATSMMFLLFISPLDVYPESVNQDIRASETAQTFQNSLDQAFSDGMEESVNQYMIEFNDNLVSSGPSSDASQEFNDDYSVSSSSYYSVNDIEGNFTQIFNNDRRELQLDPGNNPSFDAEGLKIRTQITLDYSISDPITGISKSFNDQFVTETYVNGSVDPLAEYSAGETVRYRYCGYDRPASIAGSGTGSGSDVFGYAAVNPENPGSVSNKGEKIIFLDSADGISGLGGFKAVVVQDSSYSSGNDIQEFDYDRQIQSGQNIILSNNRAYVSHFREIMDNQCFIESTDAPDLFQRMEDENQASPDVGVMTFISDSSSHGEVNGDYYYFDSSRSPSNPVNITGVSSSTLDERPWFSVAESNMNYWNLSDLME
jgi:hypothetical protein